MPSTLKTIWKAVRELSPGRAVSEAERAFTLAVVGSREDEIAFIRELLLGPSAMPHEIARSSRCAKGYLAPTEEQAAVEISRADIVLATGSAASQTSALTGRLVVFDPRNPEQSLNAALDTGRGAELRIALAACFPAFRREVARRIIREVSRENAVFVIATALGDVVPSVFQPVLGIAEAAGDTAFLTANQVRMLFLIGAAYGKTVGYGAQWREIASVVGAAFGWRAIARELVSKIPFGGGLLPKGAVAYAGTSVIGEGLVFLHTTGRHMTRAEVRQAFARTYSESVEAVRSLVGRVVGRGKGAA